MFQSVYFFLQGVLNQLLLNSVSKLSAGALVHRPTSSTSRHALLRRIAHPGGSQNSEPRGGAWKAFPYRDKADNG